MYWLSQLQLKFIVCFPLHVSDRFTFVKLLLIPGGGGGGGYSHTLPIRVCAAQRVRDFEAPDLEQGIHFRGIF